MHPKEKGEISEAFIAAHLLEAGYAGSKPFGDNQRYDLIIDDGETLQRVQCKTGNYQNGAIGFSAVSVRINIKEIRVSDYVGQVELFAVWCFETQKVYLVPIDEVGKCEAILRVEPTKNNQKAHIRWATDYELRPRSGRNGIPRRSYKSSKSVQFRMSGPAQSQ